MTSDFFFLNKKEEYDKEHQDNSSWTQEEQKVGQEKNNHGEKQQTKCGEIPVETGKSGISA